MSRSPLAGFRPPPPPPELRGRVLTACAEAAALGERSGPLDRLWESRPARLAWLAAVLALTAANLIVSSRAPDAGEKTPPTRSPGRGAEEEVLQVFPLRPAARATWIDSGPERARLRLELE